MEQMEQMVAEGMNWNLLRLVEIKFSFLMQRKQQIQVMDILIHIVKQKAGKRKAVILFGG